MAVIPANWDVEVGGKAGLGKSRRSYLKNKLTKNNNANEAY
jgi:hypothetical protein